MTKEKKDGFRVRMGGVHTWAGLVMTALLFAIFWTGTLSVFDKEIDRWMMPATRITADEARPLSIDEDVMPILMKLGPNSAAWTINLPSERSPVLGLAYDTPESHLAKRPQFHPATWRRFGAASATRCRSARTATGSRWRPASPWGSSEPRPA